MSDDRRAGESGKLDKSRRAEAPGRGWLVLIMAGPATLTGALALAYAWTR